MATSQYIQRVKACIVILDPSGNSKGEIPCMFNPPEISLSKSAEWATTKTAKNDVSVVDFTGGKAASLSMKLFFDTTSTGEDVRKHTDRLLALTLIDPESPNKDKPQPPLCKFVWGKIISFTAYVPSVSLSFTMFLPDGTPVRAEASVTFQQFKDDKIFEPQNPTSRSEARKTRIVLAGETLDLIAYQEYGDPAKWRHIAETNNLSDPLDLQPGQILKLVPLP